MDLNELVARISEKDFDLVEFVQLAIEDVEIRDELVGQMCQNPAIMVYYHCFYVIEAASETRPKLFYPYWDSIVELIQHPNSYHRDFAISIIGNLTMVDDENRFSDIEDDYFSLVNDEKFMTGNFCVVNLIKIYRHKTGLREKILALLLDIEQRCDYPEKQLGVLKADVLDIFDLFYTDIPETGAVDDFIRAEVRSVSPKTRKKAGELVKKYSLEECK